MNWKKISMLLFEAFSCSSGIALAVFIIYLIVFWDLVASAVLGFSVFIGFFFIMIIVDFPILLKKDEENIVVFR